MNSAKITRC